MQNDYLDYISHHGISGQKWGVQNGPPYPLSPEDYSSQEKKLNKISKQQRNLSKKASKAKIKAAKLDSRAAKLNLKSAKAKKKGDEEKYDKYSTKAIELTAKAAKLDVKSLQFSRKAEQFAKKISLIQEDIDKSNKASAKLGVDLYVEYLNGNLTKEEFNKKAPAGYHIN